MDSKVKTAKERIEELDRILDDYINKIGIKYSEIQSTDEISTYLTMERGSLSKLSCEDCAEITVLLQSFAFHLAKEQGREKARLGWVKEQLYKGVDTTQFGNSYAKYEEKRALAIKGDEYLSKLNEILIYAQARVDRIENLSHRVEAIARSFSELRQSKYKRGEY